MATRHPIRVNVNVTRRCNLTCGYCHSSSGPAYRGPELDARAWDNVLVGAEALGLFEITLTGGEPTMWAALPDAMAASRNLDWTSLEILTNAMVLTPRRVASLRSGKIARACVSLDGVPEIHDANRGPGSYDKTLDGIAALRDVVDNITVISVVDRTNALRWPALTERLIDLGVRQHHLSPVCFAGHAMGDYQGLTADQFEAVRLLADDMAPQLPDGFTLRFHDGIVHPPRGRCHTINQLIEIAKGLQLQVMPDGAVRGFVRAWGRSWRADETLGNLNNDGFAHIVESTAEARAGHYANRQSRAAEARDKFHLSADDQTIASDAGIVREIDATGTTHLHVTDVDPERSSILDDPGGFASDVDSLTRAASRALANPTAVRLRVETDIAMVFDTASFEVTLLTLDEAAALRTLGPIPTRAAA